MGRARLHASTLTIEQDWQSDYAIIGSDAFTTDCLGLASGAGRKEVGADIMGARLYAERLVVGSVVVRREYLGQASPDAGFDKADHKELPSVNMSFPGQDRMANMM